jgi:hypothetical protein
MIPFRPRFSCAIALSAALVVLAGCANSLTTRVHVYNPVQRHDELKELVEKRKATTEEANLYRQLDKLLSKPVAEAYGPAWHDRIAALIGAHQTIAGQLSASARRIVDQRIIEPARENAQKRYAAAESEFKALEAREAELVASLTRDIEKARNEQKAMRRPGAPEAVDVAREAALVEKVSAFERDLAAAAKCVADAKAALDGIFTRFQNTERVVNQSLATYALGLDRLVAQARTDLDRNYTVFLASGSPSRGDALAFATRQFFSGFLRDFWQASNHRGGPVSSSDSGAVVSAFDFGNQKETITIPEALAGFYGPTPALAETLAAKVAGAATAMAETAVRVATGRDSIVRNDTFEESSTNPLVTLAQRDTAGWTLDVATASMSSSVKSTVVVVRDTPSSYSIVSYDGDAGSTVSEGLRATANTALIALEAARLVSGVPVPSLSKPSAAGAPAGTATTTASTAAAPLPSEVYRAIARDRLEQTAGLLKEIPSDDTKRADWAKRVRALINSTPLLPPPPST